MAGKYPLVHECACCEQCVSSLGLLILPERLIKSTRIEEQSIAINNMNIPTLGLYSLGSHSASNLIFPKPSFFPEPFIELPRPHFFLNFSRTASFQHLSRSLFWTAFSPFLSWNPFLDCLHSIFPKPPCPRTDQVLSVDWITAHYNFWKENHSAETKQNLPTSWHCEAMYMRWLQNKTWC